MYKIYVTNTITHICHHERYVEEYNISHFNSVIGCADIKYPSDAWYKREGDLLTVGCENKDLAWTLRCDGHQWKGTLGNCSTQGTCIF